MRDAEVVASIVAGDPQGLATAYDRYANPLYTYCRSVLRDPADADDAVQDTFVIAASRLDGLRDPEKLRSWLYAVARNECMRILRAGKNTSGLDEAPDVIDQSADVSADAERAELRTLFAEASEGLNPNEREVIELSLRHKMEPGEIADVLGVSKNHAHSLLSRARGQLETCLAALLVGRAGCEECKELGSLLGNWDGKLTVLLRKRLHRHIEHCSTCTRRRAFVLRPDAFYGLPPLAAVAGALRMLSPADPLKAKILALATGTGPAAAAHRAALLHRAGSFNHQGFPHATGAAKAGALHAAGAKTGAFLKTPQGQGTAAAVVIAIIAASTALALTASHSEHLTLANSKPGHSSGGGSGGGAGGTGGGGGSGGAGGSGGKSGHGSGGESGHGKGGSGAGPSSGRPGNPANPGGGPGSGLAGILPSRPGNSSPSGPGPTPGSPLPPSSSPSAPSGTLTANPNGGFLTIPPGGTTVTLTNSGSTQAHWKMTSSGGSGTVTVSPSAGSLPPGGSTTVKITTPSSTAIGQTISLAPGSTTWTVLFGTNSNPGSGGGLPSVPGLPGVGGPAALPTTQSAQAVPVTGSPAPTAPAATPTCAVYAILPADWLCP